MKTSIQFFLIALSAMGQLLAMPSSLRAAEGEQAINLQIGWNAIWLEVEPVYAVGEVVNGSPLAADDSRIGMPKAPEHVFTNTNITTVASPKVLAGLAEFFGGQPSNAGNFNQEGWQQWHQPAAIGDNLFSVRGNRPYLVQVQGGNVSLNLEGTARFFRPTWTPDRYNLVGFGIDGSSPPSFDAFFGPAGARHPVAQIYTLATNGNWSVVNPASPMEPNRAYWVFCAGNSDYMGPVAVQFDGMVTGQWSFGAASDAVTVGQGGSSLQLDLSELTFTNLDSSSSITPELELMVADPGPGDFFLRLVQPVPNSLSRTLGNPVDTTAADGSGTALGETIAAGNNGYATLGAQRDWNSGTVGRTNLYRLNTGAGTEFWLPVSALRTDLQQPSDLLPASDAGAVAGLWVGNVVMGAATSLVEAGTPIRPTASKTPLRILLHSDGSGAVKLISQVTLMQTKTADPSVAPEPVLVLDPTRIPFFEGVRERQGKRMGVRIQSATFDMPRKLDPGSQAAMVSAFSGESLTNATEIADFLNGRSLRPPSLTEDYHFFHPMEGAVGAGKTTRTSSGSPLHLDPFHRSNPFRHAFHQRHPRGPDITRDIEIVFDSTQAITDRLHGSYRETIFGLVKDGLTTTGSITLERVSGVDTLDQ